MLFRSFVLGLLGAIALLLVVHVYQHAHDHLDAHLHAHAAQAPAVLAGAPVMLIPPPMDARLPPGQTRVTGDTVLVDIERSSVRALARDELLSGARIVPSLHRGLSLCSVRPGSLLAAIGLENGDVLREVNGVSALSSATEVLELLTRPERMPSFLDISLVRRGTPVRVVVLIHDA